MKKIISFALVFVFFAFTSASAQENKPNEESNKPAEVEVKEKKITELEFSAVQKKSDDKTNGKIYRLVMSSKTHKKPDNSLAYYFDETSEFVSSDKFRAVKENGSADGSITFTETVRIEGKTYNRINNGAWNISENPATISRLTQITAADSIEHTYKGKVEINNRQADLYESLYVSKTDKGGRDFITKTKVKRWFDKDGVLFRVEEEIETNNTITRKIYEWEYNPKDLTIEIPVK